jgi:hypothetical protein
MAAGLGFKTFTTGEVLTAGDVNGYLMQGILVFASTAARNAAITSPQEGQFAFTKDTNGLWYYDGSAWVASGATGDIEGVTAGVGISGGGTSGTVTITNSMATAIDAKGDLVVGTGADTFSRLAVGANGTTLVADSAEATGLKWQAASSGGMTLINTGGTTLTGASVTISSIPATYKNLQLIVQNFKPATNSSNLLARFNGDSGNNYATDEDGSGASFGNSSFYASGQANSTDANGLNVVDIFDYTSSTWKCAFVTGLVNASATTFNSFTTLGVYKTTSAISSLTLLPSSGNFTSGTAYLYGVS